jgi:predicted small metal-binding protein
MSKQSPEGVLVVEELVPIVQKHASEAHNMKVTREDVLSRARPEP